MKHNLKQYLARRLHLPTGEVLERYVVHVRDGIVLDWHPFEHESQSMILVEEFYASAGIDGTLVLESVNL
ncbi:MAG: hypothetical protein IKY73_00385 [Bacteroidaceae bacterium]|nr:hypothetical protein [Bacteroidaceae bacterium]